MNKNLLIFLEISLLYDRGGKKKIFIFFLDN